MSKRVVDKPTRARIAARTRLGGRDPTDSELEKFKAESWSDPTITNIIEAYSNSEQVVSTFWGQSSAGLLILFFAAILHLSTQMCWL